jgi:hypothetical protein
MTLLVFDGSAGSVTERVSTSGWAGVHVVRVLPQGEAPVAGAIVDVAGHARSSYGLEDASALVLVRPDGYIGYFGKPGSYARLDQYLSAVRYRNQLVPLAV